VNTDHTRSRYVNLEDMGLFRDVSLKCIDRYLACCFEEQICSGDVLLSPDIQNQHIYILLSGLLRIHLGTVDSEPINYVHPGECVGEISIIDRLEPSAFVIAETNVRLWVIPQETFWDMVEASHTVAKNLLYILTRRLRHGHGIISNNRELQKQLQKDAMIDGLTRVHNRRWFDDILRGTLQDSLETHQPLCLLLIDIDHFKSFNDRFGHSTGDRILRDIAGILLKHVRPGDMLARFGGDEFILALPDTTLGSALEIAEQLRCSTHCLSTRGKETQSPTTLSISVGISDLRPEDDVESLFERTDNALYEAKNSGRDCVISS
jgi:diguanylate cyclase (GGDEF)-like protein